jgi:hypothetical protein
MSGPALKILTSLVGLSAIICMSACSTAPSGPKPGTPAFYYDAAKSNIAAKDFLKATEQLTQAIKTDSEFSTRAQVMQMVLTAGMSKTYSDLATSYENGAKANAFRPMPLRKVSSDYLKMAESRALEFGDAAARFMKGPKDANVVLDFPFPSADMTDVRELKTILAGTLPEETVQSAVVRKTLQQSVAKSAASAVGAAGDMAKAQAAFQSGSATVARPVFMMAMANSMYEMSQLFGPKKLNLPKRLEFFGQMAKEALKEVPASKETKTLTGKLDTLLKSDQK